MIARRVVLNDDIQDIIILTIRLGNLSKKKKNYGKRTAEAKRSKTRGI